MNVKNNKMRFASIAGLSARTKQPYIPPHLEAIPVEEVGFLCVSGRHNSTQTKEEEWEDEEKIGGGDIEINL